MVAKAKAKERRLDEDFAKRLQQMQDEDEDDSLSKELPRHKSPTP